ncbi:Zn-dependent oxidoreductase [Leptospira ryugenii]|uniref:Zn-dependent oxidoreductase n=1 Tax=Leptospira ryugenii TaxID=1917863 RepID=A0A2P2E2S2_9LEPT|nr:zinc-binding dehydrogenase [Leptospira ryugenii]GBF51159.1 Zn-dependent oxidoreductase [Leptospira ryugenii]
MKAVTIVKYDETSPILELREKEMPEPKDNEVLIKIHASPINPSDLMFIRGLYGIKKKAPVAAGFEASGTVVSVGKEIRFLKPNMLVSCVSGHNDGSWSEYMLTTEENCLPLVEGITLDEACCFFVNPMTAWAMVTKALEEKHPAMIQTAAASALGKMVVRLCAEKQLPLINIVRKKEQEDSLRALGAEYVINSETPQFEKELYKTAKKLNATYAIDAVAGTTAQKVIECIPYGGKLICYGALSEQNIPINAGMILFQNKKIEGYWLTSWIYSIGLEEFQKQAKEAQKYLKTIFQTKINKRYPLEEFQEGLEYYKAHMTEGKVVFAPK